ncbi:MAG: indoleacetamide hydrolase [Comamonadaceae bacterium]|nr:MAG: indoleacetamide hydrolase [Comamonadaceae bacterium]
MNQPPALLAALGAALLATGCATSGRDTVPPAGLTAAEAAARVCAGTLSSERLVSASLERIRARPELNAFVTVDEAGALAAAREIDRRGRGAGACLPLQGVPIVVKDNIQVRGLPTTAGTPALRDAVAREDAPVVAKLREAGAVVLGKTNMHELAFGISGYNTAFNTGPNPGVRNAWDATRMSGGSSAGTAAALGAGIAAAGLGTDTGGSVRVPCALNGCASLRPTMGRYSQAGVVPISHTRDTPGPMALAAGDVELLDRIVTGAPPVRAAVLPEVRLGVVPEMLANLDGDTRAAFDGAIAKLKAAGTTVVEVRMPELEALNRQVGFPVVMYEAYDDLAAYLGRHRIGLSVAQVAAMAASPDVKGTYEALVIPRKLPAPGGLVDAAPVYKAALEVHRPALMALYARTFAAQRLDGLVFPTVPHIAPKAGPETSSVENFNLFIQNTDPGSNAGIPGVQVPIGLGRDSRMPVGLEIDGPAGSDRRLIAIGMAVESLIGRLGAAP